MGSYGFAFLAQGFAIEVEVVRLMDQAVEDGIGQGRVADGGMPVRHGQLAGDDGRAAAMAVIDDFQQVAATLIGERCQSPIINDQHLGSRHLGQGLGITAIVSAKRQCRQQTWKADIEDAMSVSTGLVGQRTGEEGLADAGRAAHEHILVRLDPVTGHQAGEQRPVETAWMTEVDILRGGGLLEFGPFEASSVLSGFALSSFAVEQQAQAFFETELADVCLLSLCRQRAGHAGQTQLLQAVESGMVKQGDVLSGQW